MEVMVWGDGLTEAIVIIHTAVMPVTGGIGITGILHGIRDGMTQLGIGISAGEVMDGTIHITEDIIVGDPLIMAGVVIHIIMGIMGGMEEAGMVADMDDLFRITILPTAEGRQQQAPLAVQWQVHALHHLPQDREAVVVLHSILQLREHVAIQSEQEVAIRILHFGITSFQTEVTM